MHSSDAINAFVVKLNLWRQREKNNNFASFHRLTEITGDDFNKNLKEDIISHLRNLQDEFERYFPEINTGSILMKVARNPFIHKVEEVPKAIQEEFTELTNDSFAKCQFHSCKLEEFWVKMQHCYSRIGIQALNIWFCFLQRTYANAASLHCLLSNLKQGTDFMFNLIFVVHYLLPYKTLKNSLLKSKSSVAFGEFIY